MHSIEEKLCVVSWTQMESATNQSNPLPRPSSHLCIIIYVQSPMQGATMATNESALVPSQRMRVAYISFPLYLCMLSFATLSIYALNGFAMFYNYVKGV